MILARIAAASSTPSWNPADYAWAWYDASDTGSISETSNKVTQWNDLSGNGYHLTQGTDADRPLTNTVTINSLNALSFVSNDWLQASTAADWKFLHDGTTYIVGTVIYPVGTPTSIQVIWTTNNFGSGSFGGWQTYNGYLTTNYSMSTGIWSATTGVYSVNNVEVSAISSGATSTITILNDPDNGTAADRSKMSINSGALIQNNTSTGTASTSNPQSPFRVGHINQGATQFGFVGYIGEILIIKGADATEENQTKMNAYLAGKWT